jgi:protein-disulfide isomerase
MIRLRRTLAVLGLITAALPFGAPARADSFTPEQRQEIIAIVREALKTDPSILRDAVNAMQADDSAKTQASAKAAIEKLGDSLISASDPVGGNPKGDVTIVEFFDTRCPYCRKIEPTVAEFLRQDRGVRVVYKDLPILGPPSVLGSKALLAAQKQGGYEKMREAVMKLPPDTTLAQIEAAAKQTGLDWTKLARDMNDPSVQAQIDQNLKLARALEIQGTPALIVGKQLIPGAVDINDLKDAVADARKG